MFVSEKKKKKPWLWSLGTLFIGKIIIFMLYLEINSKRRIEGWGGPIFEAVVILSLIEMLIINLIISPLIRRFYLKEK